MTVIIHVLSHLVLLVTILVHRWRWNYWCKRYTLSDGKWNNIDGVVFFFHKVGTTAWPREFRHFVPKAISRGKISVAIPRFLLRKKKTKHCHSIRRGLIFLMVRLPLVYSSLVTLLWLIHRDSRHVRELTRRP